MKIAIVASMFNEEISNNLIWGAVECYKEILNKDINRSHIFRVPGAFEIPFLVKKILNNPSNDFDAIVTLGCVIKGETAHFEYISNSVTNAIMQLNIDKSINIPIIYGVLTVYNYKQACSRSLKDKTNKGYEVMNTAIDMKKIILK